MVGQCGHRDFMLREAGVAREGKASAAVSSSGTQRRSQVVTKGKRRPRLLGRGHSQDASVACAVGLSASLSVCPGGF